MKVAAIQMVSAIAREANLGARPRAAGARPPHAGAELAVLPEYFCMMGQRDTDKLALRETRRRRHGAGLPGRCGARARPVDRRRHAAARGRRRGATCFNSSLAFSPDGRVRGALRQDPPVLLRQRPRALRRAPRHRAGRASPCCFDLPSRDGHRWRIGMSVCYDLRFPELYRALARQGAELLLVPSAFTHTTGAAHWEVLLRARAIENLAWVVAPAQGGTHENGRRTWGQSMVVDPWGTVVAQQARRRRRGAGRPRCARRPSACARSCRRCRTACSEQPVSLAPRCRAAARSPRAVARLALPALAVAALVPLGAAGRAGAGAAGHRGLAGRPPRGRAGAERAGPRHRRRAWPTCAAACSATRRACRRCRPGRLDARALAQRSAPRCCASTASGCGSNGATRRCARWPPSTRPTAAACSRDCGRGNAPGRRGAGLRRRAQAGRRRPTRRSHFVPQPDGVRPGGDGAVPAAVRRAAATWWPPTRCATR